MPNEVSLLHNTLHSTPTSLQDEKCLVGSTKREVSGDRGIKTTFYTEDGLCWFQVQVKSSTERTNVLTGEESEMNARHLEGSGVVRFVWTVG